MAKATIFDPSAVVEVDDRPREPGPRLMDIFHCNTQVKSLVINLRRLFCSRHVPHENLDN